MLERAQALRDSLVRSLAAEPAVTCVGAGSEHEVDSAWVEGRVDAVLVNVTTRADVASTVRRTRYRWPTARIVVTASYVDTTFADTLIDAGATAVLASSASLDAVVEALTTPTDGAVIEHSHDRDRQAAAAANRLGITERQHEVLRLFALGRSPDQIARALDIKLSTCRDHLKALRKALDATNSVELVVGAVRHGLLPEFG